MSKTAVPGRATKRGAAVRLLLALAFAAPAAAANDAPMTALKVCADPFLLPFSNRMEQGFENKIAELFAERLGVEVQYEFFPQRIGFIRNTLKAESESGPGYKCDLVINVPEFYEMAAVTEPYYRTSDALVFARGRGMDSVTEPEMLGELVRDGLQIKFGATDRGAAQFWVAQHGLMGSMKYYQGQTGDLQLNPGRKLLEDIIAGEIDAAITPGPVAGYFARTLEGGDNLVVLPLRDDPVSPYLRFEYNMAMAVRYGESEWKDQVNQLIAENKKEIDAILQEFGVPLLPLKKTPRKDDD